MDVAPRPSSDTAGPSQPTHADFRDFFNVKPDIPVFKMPGLPPTKTIVTKMSTIWTNVTLR